MIGIEDWQPEERVARFREAVEIIDKCLRNRCTTYEGQYYRLKDAIMAPPPIQRPRPPITIGAMGSSMLKLAARYADTWNSVPGARAGEWGASPDKMLDRTHRRNQLIDSYCREIGREPKTLRRSLLVFGSEAKTVFSSTDAFERVVERYQNIGITEFIFYFPEKDEQIPVFKEIARKIIPKLRAKYGQH